jgi:hypothetical protein
MGMRKKNIQLGGAKPVADAKHARPRVEHDPLLRQHKASGLPPRIGVVAGRAEEVELHRCDDTGE